MKHLVITLTTLLALTVLVSCSRAKPPALVTVQQQAVLAQLTTLSFPPSTRYIGFQYNNNFLDDDMYAKVEIPAKDLDAFLATSPFKDEDLQTKRIETFDNDDLGWFKPSSIKSFKSGTVWLPNAKGLIITIDYDQHDPVVIYISWHET